MLVSQNEEYTFWSVDEHPFFCCSQRSEACSEGNRLGSHKTGAWEVHSVELSTVRWFLRLQQQHCSSPQQTLHGTEVGQQIPCKHFSKHCFESLSHCFSLCTLSLPLLRIYWLPVQRSFQSALLSTAPVQSCSVVGSCYGTLQLIIVYICAPHAFLYLCSLKDWTWIWINVDQHVIVHITITVKWINSCKKKRAWKKSWN